jgi:hypothetical protein
MLHRYKIRDLCQFLDIFEKDITNDEGDAIMAGELKAEPIFFEKIVGILPMYIKLMSPW